MRRPAETKPDYGLDAPHWFYLWLYTGLSGSALWLLLNHFRAPRLVRAGVGAAALWGLITTPFFVFSSRVLKLQEADHMIDVLTWRGDERVLDVGCGRGVLLVKAAQHLTVGSALGVDTWQARHHASQHGSATLANAEAEGVGDKVALCDGDARRLPFLDASFDVVLSGMCIHNISHSEYEERRSALTEIVRVLKPGGQLAIMDLVLTPEYARVLRALGMVNVRHHWRVPLWAVPFGWVIARKPT